MARKLVVMWLAALLTMGLGVPFASAASSRVTAQNFRFEGWKVYGNLRIGSEPIKSIRVSFEDAVGIASSSLEMADGTQLNGLTSATAKLLSDNSTYYVEFTFDPISSVTLTVRAKALCRPHIGPSKVYVTCEATNSIVFSSRPTTALPPALDLPLPSPGADGLTPYSDVFGHWAESRIAVTAGQGLIPGEMLADNSFYPNKVVTRGEFIAIIAKLSQNTVGNISIAFQDVKESDYYYPAVKWGVGSGIVRGVSDTAFSPRSSVSRQDAAAVLYRYLTSRYADQYAVNWTAVKTKEAFADDGAIAEYAKEAVYAVQAGGIMTGRTDGRFDPQAGITRAELTVILSRILDTRKA